MSCKKVKPFAANTNREMDKSILQTVCLTATRQQRKGKEECLYSAFIQRLVSRHSDTDHTVLPANYTMPAFPS